MVLEKVQKVHKDMSMVHMVRRFLVVQKPLQISMEWEQMVWMELQQEWLVQVHMRTGQFHCSFLRKLERIVPSQRELQQTKVTREGQHMCRQQRQIKE